MKITRNILKEIESAAKHYFYNAFGCHDWTHVERVHNLAMKIGRKEGADLSILSAATYLHDIGRRDEMKSKGAYCHAQAGAKMAEKILRDLNVDEAIIQNIIHSIETHRYRNDLNPNTLEAKVLFDADKLDSIGAIGLARAFLFAGHSGSCNIYTGREKSAAIKGVDLSYSGDDSALLEYEFKLKKIKDKMMTKTGKKMAYERHEFMHSFVNRMHKEIEGII
jgi:uncharacterized protein